MRTLKNLLVLFLATAVLFVAGVIAFGLYYGDEIKGFVVNNINKNLRTEVEVQEVDFSVWESFPLASVVFSDVVIHAVDAKNDTLLAAKKLSVQLNLSDLLQKQYKITGLEVSDGKCSMLVDNSARANYVFWREGQSTSSSGFKVELEKVVINEMNFSYNDFSKKVVIGFNIDKAELNGSFYESIFDLEIKSTLKNTRLKFGELNLVESRTFFIYSEGRVDQSNHKITFKNADLGINEMNLKVDGGYDYDKEISKVNLIINSENADLTKAVDLLPKPVKKQLSRYQIKGKARFSGNIAGDISAISTPSYVFSFSIEKGVFSDKESNLKFVNSFLKGTIENGKENRLETTKLSLQEFQTTLNEGEIRGKLDIENFKKPNYEFHGSVGFGLSDAVNLFGWEMVAEPKGTIKAKLDLNGKLAEVGKYNLNDWKNSKIKGELEIADLGFQYKSRPQVLSEINGSLNFNNNSIIVNELNGKIDKSELKFSGKLNNFIGFLLEKKQPLFVDAALSSPKIDLAELLKANQEVRNDSSGYELEVSPYLTIYLKTKIDSLIFNQFKLSDLSADVIVKNERIDIRNAQFNSQEGEVVGDLFVREIGNNSLQLNCEAALSKVDIKQLFYSFNNFGQQNLKFENISGIASASVRYSSAWSKELIIDPQTIEAEIDLTIKNGVLENYTPLEALSKFVALEELKRVEFDELNNQILIKDQTVFIPKFDVASSALDVNIAGTHTFDNAIDYHFTLLLNQLLNRKAKKPAQNEFGYIEDDGLGRSKLFLKMTGTVSNPIISYDAGQLKASIKENYEKEKQTVKGLLNKEFGLFKKESFPKTTDKKQSRSPFQIEIDSSYINKKEEEKPTDLEKPTEKKKEEKSKFGKFMDKIASPNEEEYVQPKE